MKLMEPSLMGRNTVEVKLLNHRDRVLADEGVLAEHEVRQATILGVVDTGATRLVLPKSVADELGLPVTGKVSVRYADQRRAERDLVKDVQLELLGRSGVFTVTVEPDRTMALIGAIVMEDLDLLVDCAQQKLVPRDPDMIITEIE